jgi:outer membrane receptor protein involved in Fe transport
MSLRAACAAFILTADIATAQEAPRPAQDPDRLEEVIVVTASRTEQPIHEAPAAISVFTAADLEHLPAHDYGGVLRNAPGVNVTQISAREIQVTSRAATSSLSTSQLVLLDGRSVYLDFFGFVMWDLLPVDLSEIRQIEVVRGPASAVWGANAMTGVINLVTRDPRERTGTAVLLGAGDGGTRFANVSHAGGGGRYGYRLATGYFAQDAFERPAGLIPGTVTSYPEFANEGTRQPKVDLRFDYDVTPADTLTMSGGYAGTDGLVHSGIGPFALERRSSLMYLKTDWTRRGWRASAFANILDADSTNLLAVGADGRPVSFAFRTNTWNADVANTTVVHNRHVLGYGATARRNDFDLSIAPGSTPRNEYGAFLQDEVLLGNARFVLGVRWDDIDPVGSVVSPRVAFLYSPAPHHTLRLSFNRAYRAPSAINADLDTTILNAVPLAGQPFIFATRASGNPALREERMDAYELGYVGTLRGHATLTASVYRNTTRDVIDFYAADFYSAAAPPAGWRLPPSLLDVPPLRDALPAKFSYRNIGSVTNQGVELGLNARPAPQWSWFLNYSYQADPDVQGIAAEEVNAPPETRVNAGASWDRGRFFLNTTVHYQSAAMWRDVLDARYWGPTSSFTSVNAGAGARINDRVTISLTGTNLRNERIQEHVFGDILARRITAQVRLRYP